MMCQPILSHSFSLVCLIDGWESRAVSSRRAASGGCQFWPQFWIFMYFLQNLIFKFFLDAKIPWVEYDLYQHDACIE